MSATIQGSVSIAAGATNQNILSGNQFEFVPYQAQLIYGFNGSAAGLLITVHEDSDLVCDSYEPLVSATYPNNDEMDFDALVAQGTRQVVKVYNPTGGALTLYYRILIKPL